MKSPNLYEESGNVIMRGTKEYETAAKKHSKKRNNNNSEKKLKGMKKSELIKKFHELVDPDHTENVSSESKDEIIERIVSFMNEFSVGRRRKSKTRKLRR